MQDRVLKISLLAVFICVVALRATDSLDYWTHIAFGKAYLEKTSLSITEPFLDAGVMEVVDRTEWPWQVALFLLRSLIADDGIPLAVIAIVILIFVPFILRRYENNDTGRLWYAFAFVMGVSLVGQFRFLPRPEIVSYVLLACMMLLARNWARNPTIIRSFLIVIGFAFWHELHISWTMGFGVILLIALMEYDLEQIARFARSAAGILCMVLLAAVAVFGVIEMVKFASTVWAGMQTGQRMASITEMRPLWEFKSVLLKYLVITVAALIIAVGDNTRLVRNILLLGIAFVIGLLAVRNIMFSMVIMTYVVYESMDSNALFDRIGGKRLGQAIPFILIPVMFITAGMSRSWDGIWGVRWALFPKASSQFVKDRGLTANVFNNFDIGGYLNWSWGGTPRTFIDGRSLGGTEIRNSHEAIVEAFNAESALRKHHIQTVILSPAYRNSGRIFPAVTWFLQSPYWHLVNAEDALVFTRDTAVTTVDESEAWIYVLGFLEELDRFVPEMRHIEYSKGVALYYLKQYEVAINHFKKGQSEAPEIIARYVPYIRASQANLP